MILPFALCFLAGFLAGALYMGVRVWRRMK